MKTDFDVVIFGAGIIGLACARKLSMNGFSVIVIEKNSSFGQETSSRNSEVIHSGIYYKKNSNKALLCRKGLFELYDYCKKNNIEHANITKWVVATSKLEEEKLDLIYKNAQKNGCNELYYLSNREIRKNESQLTSTKAFCSPYSGIVDSHSLMLSFIGEIESHSGSIVYESSLIEANSCNNSISLNVLNNDGTNTKISANFVINCSGLNALNVAKKFEQFKNKEDFSMKYVKGNYFSYVGNSPFSRLIYPVPEEQGLGIHLTIDLAGQARFGPDVEEISEINYHVNNERKNSFIESIKKYWKHIDEKKLLPSYSGIRPKILKRNKLLNDFVFDICEDGNSKLINLLGFESPGLTSSIAIADKVFRIIED